MPKVKGKTGKGHYWRIDPNAKNQFNDSTIRRRPRGYRAIIQASKLNGTQTSTNDESSFAKQHSASACTYPPTGYFNPGYFQPSSYSVPNDQSNNQQGHPNSQHSNNQHLHNSQHPSNDQKLFYLPSFEQNGATEQSAPMSVNTSSAISSTVHQLDQPNDRKLPEFNLSPPLDQSDQVSSTFDVGPDRRTGAQSGFYSTSCGTSKPFELNSALLQQDQLNTSVYQTNQVTTSPCFSSPSDFTSIYPPASLPVDTTNKSNYSRTGYPAYALPMEKTSYSNYSEIAYPDAKQLNLMYLNANSTNYMDRAYPFHGSSSTKEEINSTECRFQPDSFNSKVFG